ncbi:RagB/SusD family nutrient uptake outer membrane protein [Flammeovirga pacifica]|uniref:RagB/SusD family nutrient uptake outer membrane protein n=1 Tax=Flammeovirga pacifica TaxID=915059 RepID=A0A1S1YUI0_FLAPC|nr:RagB/SusD family nutrient uptake outer membrane protein [Flammeovirga pacifica]OHX64678.1 hypothetical protein NH26_24230 [Flammeovirga pacifica]
MKKLINIIIAGVCLLPTMWSCAGFLEETNPNAMTTSIFGSTPEELNMGLTAVYSTFKEKNLLAIVQESNRDDMTIIGVAKALPTNNEYYYKTFNSATSIVSDKWSRLYKGIFRANQVIENYYKLYPEELELDLAGEEVIIEDENDTHRFIIAQARFFRGLFHFYLHSSFNNGSVIIFDFIPENETDFYQYLQDESVVREFFLKEFEFAKANLPVEWIGADQGRVTSGAAAALIGKSYLYSGEYDKAAEYLKDVIDNYGYTLTENINDNFSEYGEFNSESILEISYSNTFNQEFNGGDDAQTANDLPQAYSFIGGFGGHQPSLWLTMAYKDDPMDPTDNRNYYEDESGIMVLRPYSLRASYSIALVDDIVPYYQTYPFEQNQPFRNQRTSYFRKHTRWETHTSEIENGLIRSGLNVRVIRLADVYLMYAEAMIKGGKDDAGIAEALKFINKVRYRSALELIGPSASSEYASSQHNEVTYNAQSLMEHLMYIERPLELSIEGHAIRTIDLRRWGITKQRFEELSTREYHVGTFTGVDASGKTINKWGSVLFNGASDNNAVNKNEFGISAVNYVNSLHDYWPLPNAETISNPNFN